MSGINNDALHAANRRSRLLTEGVVRSPNRAMLRAVGFADGDFAKPIIGVANAHSNADIAALRNDAALHDGSCMNPLRTINGPRVIQGHHVSSRRGHLRLVLASQQGAVPGTRVTSN